MPIANPSKDFLLHVRKGDIRHEECLKAAEALETKVKSLMEAGPLPEKPDSAAVEEWMLETYYKAWSATYGHSLQIKFHRLIAANQAALDFKEDDQKFAKGVHP